MKKLLVAASLVVAAVGNANAQQCAHTDLLNNKLANDPTFLPKYEQFKKDVNEQVAAYDQVIANTAQKTTATPMIPVVFHVVLTQAEINQVGGVEGLYKRATLQLDALNRDFNGQNPDSTKMHTAFKSRFGHANVYFTLPHRKPDGKGTLGVEVKVAPVGFGGYGKQTDSMKDVVAGGLDPWDPEKYLNVWIVNINYPGLMGWGYSPNYASLLGIAQFQGIVIDYQVFGQKKSPSVGAYVTGADSGRTLVHEMGHFFNLWHIWGNTNVGSGQCGDDDEVGDTPEQSDANQNCSFPTVIANCVNSPQTGGEMYMNYMDYTGDKCTVMFTKGQVTRMLAQIAPGGPSVGLTQHPEVLQWPTGVDDIAQTTTVEIFPNPTNGLATISFSNTQTLKSIHVINMMGQSIKQINSENGKTIYTFDLSGLPAGVYSVQSQFEEGTVTSKIVLQ
ncbi:zinc-dependent metalloprotease [Polluticoccus soli]|uniref:zinc-dependent metalloprotease n=1 Tax=Polluticoccus soli TaxID=3034150 RepID=UPI0023E2E252|nr:zinc-dependent metalloprotease [Flavipsychrobacter sp. JY13-12]